MKKKNKKKWLSTFVGGLLGFAVGAAGGLLMVKIADKTDSIRNGGMWTFVLNILIVLGAIYASMFLHILVHEGGHLVFGMLTGYKFNSFRIGSRILLKTEQGLRWKKSAYPGDGRAVSVGSTGTNQWENAVCVVQSGWCFDEFSGVPDLFCDRSGTLETASIWGRMFPDHCLNGVRFYTFEWNSCSYGWNA